MTSRRANPDRLLSVILASPDRAAVLATITTALGDTWESGHTAGVRDGIAEATRDNPPPRRPNPYDQDTRHA